MVSAAALAELAPSGTLRAAINFDNTILASKDPATGEPGGISVELAREVAQRLAVPVAFVPYYAAAKVVEGLDRARGTSASSRSIPSAPRRSRSRLRMS